MWTKIVSDSRRKERDSTELILNNNSASLFPPYQNFYETTFIKVDISINELNCYIVFHQPEMSIIPDFGANGGAKAK